MDLRLRVVANPAPSAKLSDSELIAESVVESESAVWADAADATVARDPAESHDETVEIVLIDDCEETDDSVDAPRLFLSDPFIASLRSA